MKIIIKIILLFIIALFIYLLFPIKNDKLIYIPPKNNKYFEQSIHIQKTNLNSLDILILKLYNIKSGWVRVSPNANRYQLFKELLTNKRESTRKVVMYGGDTIYNFTKTIAKQTKLNRDKLEKIYKKLSPFYEAGIIAQKYDIPYKTTEYSLISYMVGKTNNYYKVLAKNEGLNFKSKAFKKRLIIASIIEKETQDYNEMPLISAVIQNRLKRDIKLQMDATLNYGKFSHTIITPTFIRHNKSKYNTYKYKGLPPEPIGSVSRVSLLSAFLPAKVNYMYFVKKPKGGHVFSITYKKHKSRVQAYKTNLSKIRARKLNKLINKPLKIYFPNMIPKIHIPVYKSK